MQPKHLCPQTVPKRKLPIHLMFVTFIIFDTWFWIIFHPDVWTVQSCHCVLFCPHMVRVHVHILNVAWTGRINQPYQGASITGRNISFGQTFSNLKSQIYVYKMYWAKHRRDLQPLIPEGFLCHRSPWLWDVFRVETVQTNLLSLEVITHDTEIYIYATECNRVTMVTWDKPTAWPCCGAGIWSDK